MSARLTRRGVIGATLATPMLASRLWALSGLDLRIGAVLPLAGPSLPQDATNLTEVAEAARRGLVFGEEEVLRNGALFGHNTTVFLANAPGAAAAERAARRLVAVNKVSVLIGGFTTDDTAVLSKVAEETGTLFLNIAAPSDLLRRRCSAHTFHVEASAAMYLDALTGWFLRAGHRRWVMLHGADAEGEARLNRATKALKERHWGARIAGTAVVGGHDHSEALALVRDKAPDAVFLLVDWKTQLDFLARYEAEGLTAPIVAFPETATQTRSFYAKAMQAAPRAGAAHRAALWEPTLDAYGGRELNARAAGRWGAPLDPVGWAAYQATRIAFDAARYANDTDGGAMAAYLSTQGTVLDVHKGIGVSFRPWDHQLRQSLYLVRLNPEAGNSLDVAAMNARAHLVGELPAIYMPGTDPIERLDQLGDISNARCQT